jgi:hypothetical protein
MVDGMSVQGVDPNGAIEAFFRQAEATRSEDFFEYRFPFPVQLGSRQSALLPFVRKPLDVERLSIFNGAVDRGHPRLGARIRNTTGVPFEPGPVTFFQGGRYAGEAVLDYLPRDERRLVSYGVDNEVHIFRTQQGAPDKRIRLTISGGVAVCFTESVRTTRYAMKNAGDEKTLVIEHPRDHERKLRTKEEPWETTEDFYRFKVTLDGGATLDLPIEEVGEVQTEVALSSLNRDQLVLLSVPGVPSEVYESLEELIAQRESIASAQSDINSIEITKSEVLTDQSRLRENLKALGETREDQELRKRYLTELGRQEDQLRDVRARLDVMLRDLALQKRRLADLIAALAFKNE